MLYFSCSPLFCSVLQLSMFVEYTWQCMKLPDQPSVSTTSSGHQPVASRRPKQPTKTEVGFFGGAVGGDVTVAAADSTTQGMCHSQQCV